MIFLLLPIFAIMALAYFCILWTLFLVAFHVTQLLFVPYAELVYALLIGATGSILGSVIEDIFKKYINKNHNA